MSFDDVDLDELRDQECPRCGDFRDEHGRCDCSPECKDCYDEGTREELGYCQCEKGREMFADAAAEYAWMVAHVRQALEYDREGDHESAAQTKKAVCS